MPLRSWWNLWRADSEPTLRLTPPVARVPWPPSAQRFIADEQESAFFSLARAMRLRGTDEAYRLITGPAMPRQHLSTDKFERDLGRTLSADERRQYEDLAAAQYAKYFGASLPSPYEDPNFFPLLLMIFDRFQNDLARDGGALEPLAIVATLPSGAVNARIVHDAAIGPPIVFFERGLFRFLHTFAILVGWAIPAIPFDALNDDSVLMQQDWRHFTAPPDAGRHFATALATYITEGTPALQSIPMPPHNAMMVTAILDRMERFVLAHELAHVNLGHLARPCMAHEFEADSAAVVVVTESGAEYGGRAVAIWACDLALAAVEFLYRGLSVLAFGTGGLEISWTSKTHPHAMVRRANVRWRAGRTTAGAHPTSIQAAERLWTMCDICLEKLWKATATLLLEARVRGERPSPLWNDEIRSQLMTSRLQRRLLREL